MKEVRILTLIGLSVAALKIVERYRDVLDKKDISNVSMQYLLLSIAGSLVWLYTQVREGDNVGASVASLSIALETYVLSLLIQREIVFNGTKPIEITQEPDL